MLVGRTPRLGARLGEIQRGCLALVAVLAGQLAFQVRTFQVQLKDEEFGSCFQLKCDPAAFNCTFKRE